MEMVGQLLPWIGNGKPSEPNQSKPTTIDDRLMTTTNGLPTEDGRGEGTKDTRVQEDSRIVGRKDENGRFRAGNGSEVQHRDDRQRRRKSEELRQKMQYYESQMREMEQDIQWYVRENQRIREGRAQAREDRKAMEMKCNLAEKESASLGEQLQTNRSENNRLRHDNQALQEELRRKEQEIKALQTASRHKEATHSQVAALLETRTSELKGAQTFLTKADTFSGADLILMVEGLNADILETAAYMTDTFDFGQSSQMISTGRQQSVHESIKSGLGQIMTNLLVQHGRDQMLIQIAVQAHLSRWCHHIASTWIIDAEKDGFNGILADLYEIISANGEFICDVMAQETNIDSCRGPIGVRALAGVDTQPYPTVVSFKDRLALLSTSMDLEGYS